MKIAVLHPLTVVHIPSGEEAHCHVFHNKVCDCLFAWTGPQRLSNMVSTVTGKNLLLEFASRGAHSCI